MQQQTPESQEGQQGKPAAAPATPAPAGAAMAPGPTTQTPAPDAQGPAAKSGKPSADQRTRDAMTDKAKGEDYQAGAGRVAPGGPGAGYAKTKDATQPPRPGSRKGPNARDGRPYSVPVPQPLERQLGADFSDVRVHFNTGKAEKMGAEAYTSGKDVHFADAAPDLRTPAGEKLLAHELEQVLQQDPEKAAKGPAPMGAAEA